VGVGKCRKREIARCYGKEKRKAQSLSDDGGKLGTGCEGGGNEGRGGDDLAQGERDYKGCPQRKKKESMSGKG